MSVGTCSLLLIPLAIAGCAKNPLDVESASSALRSAEVAGAEQIPQASLHLQLAREQLALAEQLNADGDEDEAKSMLARAAADGELALLLAHEQAERDQAKEALDRVQALRNAR